MKEIKMFGVPCPIKTERQFIDFIQTGKHEKRNSLSTKGQIVISLHFPQSGRLKVNVRCGKKTILGLHMSMLIEERKS